jgi:hypothetical protein
MYFLNPTIYIYKHIITYLCVFVCVFIYTHTYTRIEAPDSIDVRHRFTHTNTLLQNPCMAIFKTACSHLRSSCCDNDHESEMIPCDIKFATN